MSRENQLSSPLLAFAPEQPAHAKVYEAVAADGSPSSKWQHPPSFYCPISQQCFHDPVVLADGHTYERRYIERWLKHHSTSPVSGMLLPQKDMFPNHALRNAIEEYFQQVFSVHRRAIRQSFRGDEASHEGLGSNASLLRTIDSLMQCSLLMNADLSIEWVLRRIVDEAKTLVGAEVASVFVLDAARQELYSTVNSTGVVIRIPVTNGIAGHVATSGEPVVIADAYGDPRFNKSVDVKTGFKTRNLMCVPLKVKKGGVIGVVQLINKSGPSTFTSEPTSDGDRFCKQEDAFTPDDLQFLQVFASQAATAIANSRTEAEEAEGDDGEGAALGSSSPSRNASKNSSKWCKEAESFKVVDWEEDCSVLEGSMTIPDRFVATAEDYAELRHVYVEADVPEDRAAWPAAPASRGEEGGAPAARTRAVRRRHSRRPWAEAVDGDSCQGAGGSDTPWSTEEQEQQCLDRAVQSEEAEADSTPVAKRRSGRTRQRVAKWWSKVRVRTPSPDSGLIGAYGPFA